MSVMFVFYMYATVCAEVQLRTTVISDVVKGSNKSCLSVG